MEHGFYDEEIIKWSFGDNRKKMAEKYGNFSWDYYKNYLRIDWFRNKFPEFFEG